MVQRHRAVLHVKLRSTFGGCKGQKPVCTVPFILSSSKPVKLGNSLASMKAEEL